MYNVRLNEHYDADLRVLADAVTDSGGVAGAARSRRSGSSGVVDVNVLAGDLSLFTILQEKDLYLKGFRSENGTFFFKGTAGVGHSLKFNCSYTDSDGMDGIYQDKFAKNTFDRYAVASELGKLAAFNNPGGNDLALIGPSALLAFVVSEAIRFTCIREAVAEAVTQDWAPFTLAAFWPYVKSWRKLSEGRAIDGTVPNQLYTSY